MTDDGKVNVNDDRREGRAATVAELYPGITRIMLFVAFGEAAAGADPNYQQIIFTGDAEAAFRLDCSREECVGGGFDYGPMISRLVASGETRVHGTLACSGRCGSGAGERPCSLQSEYRIFVD